MWVEMSVLYSSREGGWGFWFKADGNYLGFVEW